MAAKTVILEGIHKTGKSTVAEFLQKFFNFSVYKDLTYKTTYKYSIQKQQEIFTKIIKNITNFAEQQPNEVRLVLDRHHLTDYAYSKLFRTGSEKAFYDVDNQLVKMNAVLIMMSDDIEKINERNKMDFSNIYKQMNKAYELSNMKKYKLNYNDPLIIQNLITILQDNFDLLKLQ